jgi:type II secretory pathway component HofQ
MLAVVPVKIHAQDRAVMTVRFEDASIQDVAQTFAEFTGLSVVVHREVGEPRVTAEIRNMPWQDALKSILDAHNLVALRDTPGVIRIQKRSGNPQGVGANDALMPGYYVSGTGGTIPLRVVDGVITP